MPNTRKQPNNNKPRPRKSSGRPRSFGGSSMQGAPVAVSEDLQQSVSFGAGSRPGQLRMRVCAPIAQLLRIPYTGSSGGAIHRGFGTVSGSTLLLNLTAPQVRSLTTKSNLGYTSPVFDLIASAFVRYKIKSLKFIYEPQSAATVTERMVFAFAEDPLHPILNQDSPTSDALLSVADSVAFMPWKSWSMDVTSKINTKDTYYTYSDPSTTVGTFTERFSDFGCFAAVTSSTTSSSEAISGVLYMMIDVELIEFCPISVTRPSLVSLAKRLKDQLKVLKSENSSAENPTLERTEKILALEKELENIRNQT